MNDIELPPLPESSYDWDETPMYSADTMRAYARAAVRLALERAAQQCEVRVPREAGYGGQWEGYGPSIGLRTAKECADAIRALKVGA